MNEDGLVAETKTTMNAEIVTARVHDLLLTIARRGECWRARVEEIGDPDSGLSDATDYASLHRAKLGAVAIARELFGTSVPEEELEWRTTPDW